MHCINPREILFTPNLKIIVLVFFIRVLDENYNILTVSFIPLLYLFECFPGVFRVLIVYVKNTWFYNEPDLLQQEMVSWILIWFPLAQPFKQKMGTVRPASGPRVWTKALIHLTSKTSTWMRLLTRERVRLHPQRLRPISDLELWTAKWTTIYVTTVAPPLLHSKLSQWELVNVWYACLVHILCKWIIRDIWIMSNR